MDFDMEIEIQDDCLYSLQHEWARKNEDGTYTIGITPFGLKQLGYITSVDFEVNDDGVDIIEAGSEIVRIESSKCLGEIYSPVTGIVTKTNSSLEDNPDLINESPWEDGWIMVIEPETEDEYSIRDCISPDEYRKLIAQD